MNQAIANAIVALARASVGGSAACVETVDVEARRRAAAPLWMLLHSVETERQCAVQEAPSKAAERKRKSSEAVGEEPGRLGNGVQPTLLAMFSKRPAP